jgi:hypothetical protein
MGRIKMSRQKNRIIGDFGGGPGGRLRRRARLLTWPAVIK